MLNKLLYFCLFCGMNEIVHLSAGDKENDKQNPSRNLNAWSKDDQFKENNGPENTQKRERTTSRLANETEETKTKRRIELANIQRQIDEIVKDFKSKNAPSDSIKAQLEEFNANAETFKEFLKTTDADTEERESIVQKFLTAATKDMLGKNMIATTSR